MGVVIEIVGLKGGVQGVIIRVQAFEGNGDVRENKCFGGEENYLVNRGCDTTGGRHHANHIDKV